MSTFSTGELNRARVARRSVAVLLIVAGVAACGLNLLDVRGALLGDVRLLITTTFLILGPGWAAAGFLRRAPAAHVWLLAVGVGISVTLIAAQLMVSSGIWAPSGMLFVLTALCSPFLFRHAVVAQ